MIRRLIEADILQSRDNPTDEQVIFWLKECRTPELLIELVHEYPDLSKTVLEQRPLLIHALQENISMLETSLIEEMSIEIQKDRKYWAPPKKELEQWRRDLRKE